MGINAAACTFMAFCRPRVLQFYAPAGEYNADATATIGSMGVRWMISYACTLIFLHHFILFYLEMFSFHNFFITLAKVILSLSLIHICNRTLLKGLPVMCLFREM